MRKRLAVCFAILLRCYLLGSLQHYYKRIRFRFALTNSPIVLINCRECNAQCQIIRKRTLTLMIVLISSRVPSSSSNHLASVIVLRGHSTLSSLFKSSAKVMNESCDVSCDLEDGSTLMHLRVLLVNHDRSHRIPSTGGSNPKYVFGGLSGLLSRYVLACK
jgi:hypothetical protein